MESTFFKQLAALNLRGNLSINIRIGDGEKLQVSVLLSNPNLKDNAARSISPMLLEGTAAEMDQGFYEALTTPLQKTNTFYVNALHHEQSLSNAIKNAAMTKANQMNATSAQKKKYEAKMEKVTELEKKSKIGEAIAQMPTVKEFPEYEKQINTKLADLKSRHSSLSLFGSDERELPTARQNTALNGEEGNEDTEPEYEADSEEETEPEEDDADDADDNEDLEETA